MIVALIVEYDTVSEALCAVGQQTAVEELDLLAMLDSLTGFRVPADFAALQPLAAKGVLKTFSVFDIVRISAALIHEAIDCTTLNQLSFRDSLILAAAASAGCSTVFSEDLAAGQVILGVRVQNPLV